MVYLLSSPAVFECTRCNGYWLYILGILYSTDIFNVNLDWGWTSHWPNLHRQIVWLPFKFQVDNLSSAQQNNFWTSHGLDILFVITMYELKTLLWKWTEGKRMTVKLLLYFEIWSINMSILMWPLSSQHFPRKIMSKYLRQLLIDYDWSAYCCTSISPLSFCLLCHHLLRASPIGYLSHYLLVIYNNEY